MVRQVAILHGWSDTSDSFVPLAQFLQANGYKTIPLWLGDYISLNDDVKVEDVAKRMDDVVKQAIADQGLDEPFDLIVHSTGGLVARQWLSTYYAGAATMPVRRLLMLAPANFGSRLAAMGKSMLGRIVKGWNNWFHTGQEMLNGLELASPLQWDLARQDLFIPDEGAAAPSCYGLDRVLPFVIVGSHPYPSGPRTIVNENGSDGTVRVAAANLNAQGITVDFSADPKGPRVTPWMKRHGEDFMFPLAVLPDRTHASIINPAAPDVPANIADNQALGRLILDALACDTPAQYKPILDDWYRLSEQTAKLADDEAERTRVFKGENVSPDYFHQYMQVVVRVVDDHGADVPDFFIEFFGGEEAKESEAVFFHREILEDVHPNSQGAGTRCLFIDRTDLMERFYPMLAPKPQEVHATITAAPPGDDVAYFGWVGDDASKRAGGTLKVHSIDEGERWLKRNTTHFVKMIIPRVPKETVFRLKRF